MADFEIADRLGVIAPLRTAPTRETICAGLRCRASVLTLVANSISSVGWPPHSCGCSWRYRQSVGRP